MEPENHIRFYLMVIVCASFCINEWSYIEVVLKK